MNAISTLNESIERLSKRAMFISKKVDACKSEALKARGKDKRKALQAMRRLKMYQREIERVENTRFNLCQQIASLEEATVNTGVVNAMQGGVTAMKRLAASHTAENVEDLRDQIQEQTDDANEIGNLLSEPMGGAADLLPDDLEREYIDLLRDQEDVVEEAVFDPSIFPPVPSGIPAGESDNEVSTEDLEALEELEREFAA